MNNNKSKEIKTDVDFAITVYENDWEVILKTQRLRNALKRCNYDFNKRTIYINNVKDYDKVINHCQKYIDEGLIDEYVVVKDYEKEVVAYFQIQDLQGFYYLIHLLTIVYLTSSPYFLSFTGDSILLNDEPWIDDAIHSMNKNPKVISCGALKERHLKHVLRDTIFDDNDFYYSRVFTDQCFLGNTASFKEIDYNQKNDISNFYPDKSRGAFEERVYCHLLNNDYFIGKSKRAIYRNKNFSSSKFVRFLYLNVGFKWKKHLFGKELNS